MYRNKPNTASIYPYILVTNFPFKLCAYLFAYFLYFCGIYA